MRHPENPWWEDWLDLLTLPLSLVRRCRLQRKEAKRHRRIEQLGAILDQANRREATFAAQMEAEAALEELLDLAENDPDVQELMQEHQLTRADLRGIYSELVAAACGEHVRGHYVAASTIAYRGPLHYYLHAPKQS